ncbi:MAG: hypothetical protein M0Z66_05655 [Thermaerobacter sp.]|nr:hypothetical protein [Thermaerobacter sp.]
MLIRGLHSRAGLDRLRDPLWLPILCAVTAYLGWQAAAMVASRPVLVPRRALAVGTRLSPALVQVVRWDGGLPSQPLHVPEGTLRVAAVAGLPLLANEVGRGTAGKPQKHNPLVALPASALLSAPPVAPGTLVSLYAAASGTLPQLICPTAMVAPGSTQQSILLDVPTASLAAVVDAISAGRLIVVGDPH